MTTFANILNKFRRESFSERDKGFRFERLMQAYLKTTALYANLFEEVWLWTEFPFHDQFGGKDTGIDLVARTVDGAYWAIQCKCYAADTSIDKPDVDTFLSTSGKLFETESGTTGFVQRLWISTTNKWSSTADQTIRNQNPPVTRLNLIDLENDDVDWSSLEQGIFGVASRNTNSRPSTRPMHISRLTKPPVNPLIRAASSSWPAAQVKPSLRCELPRPKPVAEVWCYSLSPRSLCWGKPCGRGCSRLWNR